MAKAIRKRELDKAKRLLRKEICFQIQDGIDRTWEAGDWNSELPGDGNDTMEYAASVFNEITKAIKQIKKTHPKR